MKLRHKFGLLASFYVITLAANVAMCAWCLLLYHQAFLDQAADDASDSLRYEDGEIHSDRPSTDAQAGQGFRSDRVHIFRILLANAACGVAAGGLGLMLVRRWVVKPIAALRDAAVKIGQGNLSYPVESRGDDELADLAGEVRSMASSIVTMQELLVEHERRQMAVQALRCIMHNVRSPLMGIRWVAEAVGMRPGVDADTAREQHAIVREVDETLRWLQSYRQSLQNGSAAGQETSKPD